MAKVKTAFFCKSCGYQASKWMGRCPSCGEWNTFEEEVMQREVSPVVAAGGSGFLHSRPAAPVLVSEISVNSNQQRINSGSVEFNRVLGGGIVPGSLVLLGGEPGIGKSTLMLQIALRMQGQKILYVSGEESEQQLKMRADRLGFSNNAPCFILTETNTQQLFQHIEKVQPDIVVIDSIQTLHTDVIDSSAGSISQIRETASELLRFAKATQVPVFLIGHITKDGSLAGPKILEHMVDTVLQFEGDRNYGYRLVRAVKNRFGSTSELGIFEMQNNGLREVSNPSEILISQRDENISGIAIAATIEGLRPMLIETQALVGSSAAYGTPQRSATGFDFRRMSMLLAVLEKKCGFRLGPKDIFLNIAGGLKVDDPAIDLAIVASVLSSNEDVAIDAKDCFAAEIGLSGEIRPVSRIDQRIAEAEKLGFRRIFTSKYNLKGVKPGNIEIVPLNGIGELYQKLFI